MNNSDTSSNKYKVDTAELDNSFFKRITNFSAESNNSKPYDIAKMTGKSSGQSNNEQEG